MGLVFVRYFADPFGNHSVENLVNEVLKVDKYVSRKIMCVDILVKYIV